VLVAASVATRVHAALREPFELGGVEFFASASIGISLSSDDASDAATLLKNADHAMYQSKKTEPGGYVVYASGSEAAIERLALTTRLRRAVEQRSWVLHWQPVVDLTDGSVTGLEALIRWKDPNGGLVPPGEFIPIAEELGLIEAIGDWVLEELAAQRERWETEAIDVRVGSTSRRDSCGRRTSPPRSWTSCRRPARTRVRSWSRSRSRRQWPIPIARSRSCHSSTRGGSRSRSTTSARATRRSRA
jgi:predicted signal transduction protein with EAL and GGDEF domain